MKRNFVLLLTAGAMLLSPSIWAKEPGQGKLDLVLKCVSDDGKFSKIVNLTDERFYEWNADKGKFDVNATCGFFRKVSGAVNETTCEITPTLYEIERTQMVYEYTDLTNYLYTLNKHKFKVDRTNGQFEWTRNDGYEPKDEIYISGTCALTERPKPPATKF